MQITSFFKRRASYVQSGRTSHHGAGRRGIKPYVEENAQSWFFENYTVDELVNLELLVERTGAFQKLASLYSFKRDFPDMSNFRLGPNAFDKITLDWIIFETAESAFRNSKLIGHGVTTRLPWDGNPQSLPRGWQGIVRRSYENSLTTKGICNTLVGLFINIEPEFREHGWALRAIQEMKEMARRSSMESLIIPLRLPTRYEKANASMRFTDFAFRKREDGQFLDHWLRLHVRAGAEIIGTCGSSHQHAMNLDDFYRQFKADAIETSGYHVAVQNGEWFQVFIDLERDFALINEGCVWVQYACG